jgi:hypothetical protein
MVSLETIVTQESFAWGSAMTKINILNQSQQGNYT